jgi:uncharacterized protein
MKKMVSVLIVGMHLLGGVSAATNDAEKLPQPASATIGYPKSVDKYVNDFAQVIDAADAQRIKDMLGSVEDQTGIEVSVVTINSMQDYQGTGSTIELFATALFNTWGIGKADKNNGILLLVAVKDRKMRIELGSGYPSSYDAVSAKIISTAIVPYFKEGQYSRGIYEGTLAIVKNFTKEQTWFEHYKWHLLMWLLIIICIGIAISCFRSGKKGWGWAMLAAAAGLLFFLWRMSSGNKTDGFGGGKSSGGGSSGSW